MSQAKEFLIWELMEAGRGNACFPARSSLATDEAHTFWTLHTMRELGDLFMHELVEGKQKLGDLNGFGSF